MNSPGLEHQPAHVLHRVVSLLGLLLVLYAAFFSWQSWREEKSDKIEILTYLAELERQAIDAYFAELRDGMQQLREDLVLTEDGIELDHAFSLIRRFKDNHPEFCHIDFMQGDGQVLFTAITPPGPGLPSIARHPSFIEYRKDIQDEQPLNIGRPYVAHVKKEWIIPFRYHIRDARGELAYVINAGLPVGILQTFWANPPFKEKSILGILRDDGYLVSRCPAPAGVDMGEIYDKPRTGMLVKHLKEERSIQEGSVEGPSSLEHVNFLYAFHRLERFPLTLFTAVPVTEIRAAWWGKVTVPYILSALLLIGGFLFYRVTLVRQRAREVEQWQAGEALRQSEEKYHQLFEMESDALFLTDGETGNILEANGSAERLYGYSREELLRKRICDLSAEPDSTADPVQDPVKTVLLCCHRRKDGTVFPVEIAASHYTWCGRLVRTAAVRDITERRRAEEELTESRNRLDAIIDSLPDPTLVIDTNGKVIAWNRAIEEMSGVPKERMLQKGDYEYAVPFYGEKRPILIDAALGAETGQVAPMYDQVQKDGDRYCAEAYVPRAWRGRGAWLWGTASVLRDGSGEVIGAIETAKDITERKRMENALKASEERLRLLVESAPDGIFVQVEHRFAYVNPAAVKLLGATSRGQIVGTRILDWVHPSSRETVLERIRRLNMERNAVPASEQKYLSLDGRTIDIETLAVPLTYENEDGALVFFRDITERKRAEEELRSALKEKEILLREIHHRVKNNMQIISSLLKLQLRETPDERTRGLFRDSQNRILSMAMIHEKLYRSRELQRIDLRDYVRDLSHEAFATFGESANRVKLTLAVEDVLFGMNTAIPCGLIIIELLSNAIKYAFPGGRPGEIFIGLRSDREGRFVLTVRDDGVGLPEGIEINRLKSLGLPLVYDLAKYQLQGNIEISRKGGTSIHVIFNGP